MFAHVNGALDQPVVDHCWRTTAASLHAPLCVILVCPLVCRLAELPAWLQRGVGQASAIAAHFMSERDAAAALAERGRLLTQR